MRFLADQGISPLIVDALVRAGHDAVHVRGLGMSRSSDAAIIDHAAADHRVVLTEDVGFGGLVVPTGRAGPSIVLFRDSTGRTSVRIRLLLDMLAEWHSELEAGAIIVLGDISVRVRSLYDPGKKP